MKEDRSTYRGCPAEAAPEAKGAINLRIEAGARRMM
jgi:hypothetical protein